MIPTIKPTIKQDKSYRLLRRENKTVNYVLFGGAAGGGKSWHGCEWLLTNCFFYPGSKWFIGREELKRLRESTLLTFHKVLKYHNIPESYYTYNGQDNYFLIAQGSRIDLLDLKALPSDPLYERYGSLEYTGGWIEEGGEVNFMAYDVLKSRIGRHNNDKYGLVKKMLITANPKKNWLYKDFYKPWREGSLPSNMAFVQALVDDNPYGESGYKQSLLDIRDKSLKERLLYGNWEYDNDPSALMEYDRITDLFTNSHVKPGHKYITADIARYGRDATVIGLWSGFRLEKIYRYTSKGLDEVARIIKSIKNDNGVSMSNVIVDEVGLGGGVQDMLGCKGFVANAKAKFDGSKQNYDNLKSQCYFKLADMVNASQVFVNCDDQKLKEMLIEELEVVKRKDPDKDGKVGVIPKDKVKELLGRSPDISDMVMMRMVFEIGNVEVDVF